MHLFLSLSDMEWDQLDAYFKDVVQVSGEEYLDKDKEHEGGFDPVSENMLNYMTRYFKRSFSVIIIFHWPCT